MEKEVNHRHVITSTMSLPPRHQRNVITATSITATSRHHVTPPCYYRHIITATSPPRHHRHVITAMSSPPCHHRHVISTSCHHVITATSRYHVKPPCHYRTSSPPRHHHP
jgi:hypothetical protein